MDFNNLASKLLQLFYLAAFFQGLILIIALLKKKILKSLANRILLIILISISVILLFAIPWLKKAISLPEYLNSVARLSWFCVGPLFYLYIRALFDNSFKFKWIHIVFFLFPIYHLFETIMIRGNFPFGFHLLFDDLKTYSYVVSISYTTHSLLFCFLPIKFLAKKKEKHAIFMRRFFYIFGIALILSFINGIFFINGPTDESILLFLRLLVLCFAGFVHYSGITSIRNSSHLKNNTIKYEHVKLNKKEFNVLEEKLKDTMVTKKVYLNSNLKLIELANELEINENTLSKLLNDHLNTGFYEYLKQYRLTEFEERLDQLQYKNQKIESIAKDAGFKSKTTFYQAFKEKHGISPSQYIKNHNV